MNNSRSRDFAEVHDLASRAHQRATGESLGRVSVNVLIKHCATLLGEVLSEVLRPHGLCYKNYLIMVMLYSHPDSTANPSELCLGMAETRSNMTRLTDELVERGWAQRITNSADRRRVDLSLTAAGEALLQTVMPRLRAHIAQIYGAFSESELDQLERSLLKLVAVLEAQREGRT